MNQPKYGFQVFPRLKKEIIQAAATVKLIDGKN